MAATNIIMKMVTKGAFRQECYEGIRVLSHQAPRRVKMEGKDNDPIERIKKADYFKRDHDELDAMLDPSIFTGCSETTVERYYGTAGAVEKALTYKKHIESAATAKLSV